MLTSILVITVCTLSLLTSVGVVIGRLFSFFLALSPSTTPHNQALVSKNCYFPKVCFIVPTYSEPPEVVCSTLNALVSQSYSNFHVIILDNNTIDDNLWKPVAKHCEQLGEKFDFFHLINVKGFKAGALQCATDFLPSDTELVAILDADTIIDPSFLNELVPYFQDPNVALVQTPPSYHRPPYSGCWRLIFLEYCLFLYSYAEACGKFKAIPFLGSAGIVRYRSLQEVGGWKTWSLTEDMELGWRLVRSGWSCIYEKKIFGRGLLPYTFKDYLRQRARWAHGNTTILLKYLAELPFTLQSQNILAKLTYGIALSVWLYLGFIFSLVAIIASAFISNTMLALVAIFSVIVILISDLIQLIVVSRNLPFSPIDILGILLVRLSLWPIMAISSLLAILKVNFRFIPTPKTVTFSYCNNKRLKHVFFLVFFFLFITICLYLGLNVGYLVGFSIFLFCLPMVLTIVFGAVVPTRNSM